MRKFVLLTLAAVLFWTILLIGGAGLFARVFGYTQTHTVTEKAATVTEKATAQTVEIAAGGLSELKTHRSKKLGLEFNYPDMLKVREKNGVIAIVHSVEIAHDNPCNGGGEHRKSKEIFDFYAEISLLSLTPTELFRKEVMIRDKSGRITGINSTVRITYGLLDGFRLYGGEHGCGSYTHFFQLSQEKVLQVVRWPAPEFLALPESEQLVFRQLRGIILPADEARFFSDILTSLAFTGQKQKLR